MRITTIILVLVAFLSFAVLLVATLGVSVVLVAKTSFEKTDWKLKGMELYTLEYGEGGGGGENLVAENTAHVSLGIKAAVRNSNTTRTKLPFKFSGGKFSAWVDAQPLGDGTLKEKPTKLGDSFAEVELTLDRAGLPQNHTKGLASFAEGKAVTLKVKLKSLKLWGLSIPVNKEFSSSTIRNV